MGHKGDAIRLQEAGFAAYLLKPTRQSELWGALVNVWTSHQAHNTSSELVTCHNIADSQNPSQDARRWDGTRVLVVEDNIVNQKVAEMILQSFGCRVEIAADGLEALNGIDTWPFGIIFMDGCEATAAIRSSAVMKPAWTTT